MSTAIAHPRPAASRPGRRLIVATLAAIALAGATLLVAPARAQAQGVEERAPLPSAVPVHSFAPVVKQVAPSVVTISTSKDAKRTNLFNAFYTLK